MRTGNPTAMNRPPLVERDPRKHAFLPWSLEPSRCRVTIRVGAGYTLCHLSRSAHTAP